MRTVIQVITRGTTHLRPWLAGGLLTILACAKKPVTEPTPTPASLVVVQGANQAVQGGKELPTALVLRVLASDGTPVEKTPVSFVIAAGGGSVNPGSVVSDANGEVKVKWTLGPTLVEQKLEASVAGHEPILIPATAIVPTDIVIVQGANQTARVGAILPNALVIRVVGANNTPMSGIPVAFQITAGGGVITPQSAITNNLGEVTARWTMGLSAGSNVLAAYVLSLQPGVVSANATP